MKDGLYKVQFQTPLGAGTGVIHALAGKLWGGDAGLYYVGTYSQNGDQVSASVSTARHTADPSIVPVFGRDQVTIALIGKTSGDTVQFTGSAPEAPGVGFAARATLIAG
ncbi:GrlR family regulatory protein [Rhodoplanes serenus]|uniref:GrlR family regulatory protein n=1 Tax=Rhodoplanes serenus TaxID=200615 RepID=UPI000DAE43EE|nr:GrlR family regulatory protein [Rhodoplanes serenus]RAI37108.1 hypothetical protein CH340_00960 [Rhodoplanes serenus]